MFFFAFSIQQKIQRGGPYKMLNIEIVQYGSNFAMLKKIKKHASSQNLMSLTQ